MKKEQLHYVHCTLYTVYSTLCVFVFVDRRRLAFPIHCIVYIRKAIT